MPDILICRNSALRKLEVIESGPYPRGREANCVSSKGQDDKTANAESFKATGEETSKAATSVRAVANRHILVTRCRSHNHSAIRVEVVAPAKNFLEDSLCDEQDQVTSS